MGALFLYSCEKDSTEVIDPTYSAPSISNVTITPDTVSTTSASPQVNFTVSATVTSNNSITSVTAAVFNPNNEAAGEFNLTSSGSGVYSANISLSGIQCLLVGNYKVQLVAEDAQGLFSNVIILSLPVRNTANQPVILSNPDLPDSVVRPVTTPFDLTVAIDAIDPDGKCDLNQVFFYGFRPSGFPLNNGEPFFMTNTSNDKFSFTAPVTPAAEDSLYGYYKYVFQASDRSGVLSVQYIDSIKFVRP